MAEKTSEPLYPDYLPTRPEGFTPTLHVEPFESEEPGLRADPAMPELFTSKAKIINITPRIGAEIEGVQLSKLTKDGLDQVALLAAQRGVLVFVSGLLSPRRSEHLLKMILLPSIEKSRLRGHWACQAKGNRIPLRTTSSSKKSSELMASTRLLK